MLAYVSYLVALFRKNGNRCCPQLDWFRINYVKSTRKRIGWSSACSMPFALTTTI